MQKRTQARRQRPDRNAPKCYRAPKVTEGLTKKDHCFALEQSTMNVREMERCMAIHFLADARSAQLRSARGYLLSPAPGLNVCGSSIAPRKEPAGV